VGSLLRGLLGGCLTGGLLLSFRGHLTGVSYQLVDSLLYPGSWRLIWRARQTDQGHRISQGSSAQPAHWRNELSEKEIESENGSENESESESENESESGIRSGEVNVNLLNYKRVKRDEIVTL
jgi:hypothetical protein